MLSRIKSSTTRPARLAWERFAPVGRDWLEPLRRVWLWLVPFKGSATEGF
jgi:hypothetical protein